MERGREEEVEGTIIRDDIRVLRRNRKFPVLEVPRQCPVVLLVKVCWKEDKELGREEEKALGHELSYE
jgi:hypothetical protein